MSPFSAFPSRGFAASRWLDAVSSAALMIPLVIIQAIAGMLAIVQKP